MIDTIQDGIILAAGLGSRLSTDKAKPVVPVGSMELVLRTIGNMEISGCSRIIVVLGWKANNVKSHISSCYFGNAQLIFVYNPKYRLSNGISLLCARPFIKEKFILMMADHILDERIMDLVKSHVPLNRGATLCVDYKLDTIFDKDDATKVLTNGKRIKKIGKELDDYNCVDTGVFIGTIGMMEALQTVVNKKGNVSISEGVQVLADMGKMKAIDIGDCFWQDVDTPEMLLQAEKILRENKERR